MAMETMQVNLKVTNKAQFERFTVQSFTKFSSPYEFVLLKALREASTVSIAMFNSHQPQAGTSCFLNMQMII